MQSLDLIGLDVLRQIIFYKLYVRKMVQLMLMQHPLQMKLFLLEQLLILEHFYNHIFLQNHRQISRRFLSMLICILIPFSSFMRRKACVR